MGGVMNTLNFQRRFFAALLMFIACVVVAQEKDALPSRVQVNWAPMANLSEVKNNQTQRGWMRPEEWMKTLGDHLRKRADDVLAPGQQLEVWIDDIDLAGSFEPWHGPNAQDIRFMRDQYPPRMDLHYRLTDADGSLHEGVRKLRDGAYLQKTIAMTSDPLRYDKRLINDWLRKEFGKKPQSQR
jgi:Protein of unknown function (DUF3016)